MAELEATVRKVMEAFDRKDFTAITAMTTDDAQAVDEISRRWLRGGKEIEDYFAEVGPAIDQISSELSDVHEQDWGDTGLVTCWLEQDYLFDGGQEHVSAPTTMVLRRIDGEWRIALIHSVSLPQEG
jgi:ketosteroid isomerase-like protein